MHIKSSSRPFDSQFPLVYQSPDSDNHIYDLKLRRLPTSSTSQNFSSPHDTDSISPTLKPLSEIDVTAGHVLSGSLDHAESADERKTSDFYTYTPLLLPRRHSSVPTTIVFARRAPPLYLPKLDEYLSSIPPPNFHYSHHSRSLMFQPMDKLKKSGMTLDDLEANYKTLSAWENRSVIFGTVVSGILGVTGSSALASFYSVQGIFNTIQIFALILSTIVPAKGRHIEDKWKKLFLGTIPNVLALNFTTTLLQSLLLLLFFMIIAAFLLYYFYRSSCYFRSFNLVEGLQQTGPKGPQWTLVIVTFLLTTIYLPLSTMAIHVLVWSQDLWVVSNPYLNTTSYPLIVPPLGPGNEFRDSLDFCWTTTMKKNEVNYAPVFIIISALVFICLAIFYPVILFRVINRAAPVVDKFTELGRARSNIELDEEYHRLLTRDRNPFAFLYSGFRRGWGFYESIYVIAKFSTLFIIAVIDPDNCFFRSFPRTWVSIVRQILLLLSTLAFFAAQCFYAPFLDPINNASEWMSRLNYVATSALALAVSLRVPGRIILETYVLYTVYAITYGFTAYFILMNLSFMQRAVKRLMRRIDFSIDIFSPRLDVSSISPHTKRRVWQESISTLILTSTDCAIPKGQSMTFAQGRCSEFPPCLLDFCGTPGERHVENLKILREIGIVAYNKAVILVSGPNSASYRQISKKIQLNFVGPDSYWKQHPEAQDADFTNNFGNSWWIPFPPTLVMRCDDGRMIVLRQSSEFEEYIAQNSNRTVQRKVQVRMLLRALENQVVVWPHDHHVSIGRLSTSWFGRKEYKATSVIHYSSCVLRIIRQGKLERDGVQLGSGFAVKLEYGEKNKVTMSGDAIGLNDEFDLTSPLAKFFKFNEALINNRLKKIEETLADYRRHQYRVNCWKSRVLSYGFLSGVYNQPQDVRSSIEIESEGERDPRIRRLIKISEDTLKETYERFKIISRTETTSWWYLFWDDLWRRNHETIKNLQTHATDFDPWYPTSIAYTPLPRAALESFLVQRGLLSRTGRANTFFTSGFLNKLYVRLNDTVFRSSGPTIMFHIGDGGTEREMREVDQETRRHQDQEPSMVSSTGGGTNHDNSWIQVRPKYRWEGMLEDRLMAARNAGKRDWWGWRGWKWDVPGLAKFGAWMGWTPTWRTGERSSGLAIDVRLENGRYVLSEDRDEES